MSTTLGFTSEAEAKFVALVERRNGVLDQPAVAYLRRSEDEPRDTATAFAIARFLGYPDASKVTVRRVWLNQVTTAFFIIYDGEVVEVITWHGYRRMIQRRWKYVGGLNPDGGRDGERFHAALKHKRPKQIGGGLMRGKPSPRIKKLSIISTRVLRPMRDY